MTTPPPAFDPQRIALGAIYADFPELRTGLSDDMVEADRRAKAILSAAAKMVRESGAESDSRELYALILNGKSYDAMMLAAQLRDTLASISKG